jgi:hypothetical protein
MTDDNANENEIEIITIIRKIYLRILFVEIVVEVVDVVVGGIGQLVFITFF